MAESDSWWNSFFASAKEKSISALNVTKRDLTEFMTTVTRDTTNAVSGVADSVKSYMQQTEGEERKEETVTPSDEEIRNDQSTPPIVVDITTTTYDRSQTILEALRSDPNTYCTIPQDLSEGFSAWCKEFSISDKQEEISKLLVMSNSVRKLHAELVPSKVSYESFWLHYFYRVYLLDEVDVKRAKLMERVHSSQGQLICWDEEEEEEGEIKGESLIEKEDKLQQKLDQSPFDKALTDSSESFVCISEEGMDGVGPVATSNESPPPLMIVNEEGGKDDGNNSDSDWEKWDD